MTRALHIGQAKHQPWCMIYHNPAMTTECWCDAQMAATCYKLGVAEGMAMATARFRHQEPEPQYSPPIPVNSLPGKGRGNYDQKRCPGCDVYDGDPHMPDCLLLADDEENVQNFHEQGGDSYGRRSEAGSQSRLEEAKPGYGR